MSKVLLGAHLSTSGGVLNCFSEAEDLKCTTFQIFTRNQLRWNSSEIPDKDISEFNVKRKSYTNTFSHASYLINLATDIEKNLHLSIDALSDELYRAEQLGLSYVVVHTGSAGKQDKKVAIRNFIKATDKAIDRSKTSVVKLLLETSAGQGNGIGTSFDELREMFFGLKNQSRCGICFDTCHVFASGYDIRTQNGIEDVVSKFDKTIGLKYLNAFHLNDSKKGVGSHVDRHDHIGKGCIGDIPFKFIMKNKQFELIPKVIETPKDDDMDKVNLSLLRSFS